MSQASQPRFVSISHGEDLDGLVSQLLVRRHWTEQGHANCQFFRAKYGTVGKILENLAYPPLQHSVLVLSDLNFMDDFEPFIQLLLDPSLENQLVYYDHHEMTRKKLSAYQNRPNVRIFLGSDAECASVLVQKDLFPNDVHAQFLASEANHSDVKDPGQTRDNRLLSRLITSKTAADIADPIIEQIAQLLSRPNFYASPWLRGFMEENERMCQTDFQQMLQQATVLTVDGVKVAYSWAEHASAGDTASELLKQKQVDLAVGLNVRGKASIKARSGNYRADLVAAAWGGGGHWDRAGFDWGSKTHGPKAFIEEVFLPQLRKHFARTPDIDAR